MFVEVVGDLAAAANEDRLACDGCAFCYALLVVLYKIGGQRLYALRIAKDGAHVGHRLLAVFNGVFTRASLGAFGVVLLDLFKLFVVENNLGGATFVNDGHGDLISDRFGHGVAVYHLAKNI